MSKNTGILSGRLDIPMYTLDIPMYTAEELDRTIRKSRLHSVSNDTLSDVVAGLRVSDIESINFNKLTKRTTIVYKVLVVDVSEVDVSDFVIVSTRTTRQAATVTSSEKDFVDYRVGFLLAYLKDEGKVSEKRQQALFNEVFKGGKPKITFLRGFAVHFFNSFREMDRILEAIKEEKSQVNINGNVIQITWKG